MFGKEHELMNHLDHPNLAKFFGYTLKQNYALVEYSNLGDLHTFLSTKKSVPHDQVSLS